VRGLILRERSEADRREVLLRVTYAGEALLRPLSALHRLQLETVGPNMVRALERVLALSEAEV
jgi:DNA-binding MarR family transcriptional regulator